MSQHKIYILVPYGLRTGGPEALLQLSDMLLQNGWVGRVSTVFFDLHQLKQLRKLPKGQAGSYAAIDFGVRDNTIDEFGQYRTQSTGQIPNSSSSIVVLPEVLANLTPLFSQAKVLMWWLSVDNAFSALSQVNLNFLRRPNVFHVTQSAYAERFIKAIGLQSSGNLSDYTSGLFQTGDTIAERPKQVVLNASAKVIVDLDQLEKLISRNRPDIKIVRLVGVSREQVIATFLRTKVFVDLGSFPGKDRLAREAALLGCAVIVADAGAGNKIGHDYLLDEEDHIAPWNLEAVAARVIRLLDDAELSAANNQLLRSNVMDEKIRFAHEVRAVFFLVEQSNQLLCATDARPSVSRGLLTIQAETALGSHNAGLHWYT